MLKPGMFISDRYEIIDIVGSGGMADVYKAKDDRLNRFVAIKVLKPEYSSDKSFVNKFRGEAQSVAGLSHPNIVNVYDVGDDGGLYYIVMELVEGITLKRFIERKGKLEVKEAVGIAIQIAQGMEAAHDNHIIHRDIKPQNIIISRDGKVKVTDFGIAKASNSNTITSNAMGSVHYLSPEQARGGYSDEKSDIYSLGVTLYEMLSGKVPFAGDNTVSVAMLHIQGEAKPLRELEENIPLSVDKIVQKCMQKKPERRYHSASDLIVDLKRALSNPNGDFVQIPSFVANDSPTINISDDLGKIKNSSYYSNDNYRNSRNNPVINDDDEDLDTVDSKLEKVFTVLTIVAIVAIAAAIMFIIFKFVIPSGEKEKKPDNNIVTEAPTPEPTEEPSPTPSPEPGIETYEFPNVIGHKLEDAIAAIEARNPKAHINPMEDYSNEYEVGYVIRQYPLPNTDYPVDSEVILYVSIGPSSEIIPYVYGNTWEQAEQKLKEYDLVPERVDQYSNDVPAGNVIATDPPKESMVKAGDNVKVYVSMGPEVSQTAVPDLIGKTTAEAETLLKDAGLVLGEVSQDTSETYAIGKIIYQDTTVGELVDRGTKINVTVSTGPDTEVPGTGNYRYVGSLYIEINPFYYTGDGEADIILEMEQGGYGTEIYHEMTSISDFPMTLNDIEGESLEIGVVKMYIDGEIFKDEEGNPYVWIVEFEAVED
ncbi:MAG: Stk1 family PASTA domain-containing Ser/Thr kinase [Clostridiales bacterium]|jgi:serine/threonine protein kinase/beta-lactam-binding protein with PASTA domain|nr:Stk1 family PASTA domain-containing Ser/Thr kinase [Clostridiales bacterium]